MSKRPNTVQSYIDWLDNVFCNLKDLFSIATLDTATSIDYQYFVDTLLELELLLDDAPLNQSHGMMHPLSLLICQISSWAETSRTQRLLVNQVLDFLRHHPTLDTNLYQRNLSRARLY